MVRGRMGRGGGWALGVVDVSYAAPQAHRIVNIALHREYPPVSYLYFPKGLKISIMSKTNIESDSNV
jgi:hypothetical protein